MSEESDEPLPKKAKISLGEALAKFKELDSALETAFWVISENEFVCEEADSQFSATLDRLRCRLQNFYNKQKKAHRALPTSVSQQPAMTNSMVDVFAGNTVAPTDSSTPKPGPGRPPAESFDDVTITTQLEKLKPLIEELKKAGEELGKTPTQLCGRIIQQQNYVSNRPLGLIGKSIYDGTYNEKQENVGAPHSLFLKTNILDSADRKYTELRLFLYSFGFKIPTLNIVKDYEKTQRYQLIDFEKSGFRATLPEIAFKTLSQTFQIPDVANIIKGLDPAVSFPLHARFQTGLDGSGCQPTAMQRSRNVTDETGEIPLVSQQNRETVVAVLRDITTRGNVTVYEAKNIGSTSVCRPYMLLAQKENRALLEKVLPIIDRETIELGESQMKIPLDSGTEVPVNSSSNLCLGDGKLVKEASGCGGAYCLLCISSKEDGQNVEKIQAGFELNRCMEQVEEIFKKLFDEELGAIKKRPKDYPIRQGITNAPLTKQPINQAPHPLHYFLRLYNFFQKLLYILHYLIESQKNPRDVSEKDLIAESRLIIIAAVKKATGIVMDTPTSKGGTTDTGNAAKQFFSDEVVPVLKELFPQEYIDDLLHLHKNFSVILRVINSRRKVDTEKLEDTCTETSLFLREKYDFLEITETAHMVFGHSFQLIELNDGYGLGLMSEQGLEGINKLVHRYSERYARQNNLLNNIQDVVNRLQVLSNPYLLSLKRKQRCTRCDTYGDHWTRSCPKKQVQRCNTLKEQLNQNLNEEVESYLY